MKASSKLNQGTNFFLEGYEISYDLFNGATGLWEHNIKATQHVKVIHGVNEKNNHDKARERFQELNPSARINSVTYQ